MKLLPRSSHAEISAGVTNRGCDVKKKEKKQKPNLTFHTALYPVDELVGLAAVEQSSDGGEGVQDDGLGVGINVVLIVVFFLKRSLKHVTKKPH